LVGKRTAGVAGSAVGGAAGGFFNNPGVVAILGILIAIGIPLLIFRKNITDFFSEGLQFPEIQLPTINLPTINFPEFPSFPEFPEISFPDFPAIELPAIFGGGVTQVTTPAPPDFVPLTPEEQAQLPGPCSIVQDAQGNVSIQCEGEVPPPLISSTPAPAPAPLPEIVVDPELDTIGEFVGGGPSFIGGSIGQNPVDTFFETLGLFPGLSASGAANFLQQFSGISPSEALELPGFQQFQEGA